MEQVDKTLPKENPLLTSFKKEGQKYISISEQNGRDFRLWLQLDEDTVTWQGRYQESFEEFWNIIFQSPVTINDISWRLEYLKDKSKEGPLQSWFNWVQARFIVYVFVKFDLSVKELSSQVEKLPRYIATLLRDFFVDFMPMDQDVFDEVFELPNNISSNLHLSFKDLQKKVIGLHPDKISGKDDLMESFEVTLYSSWKHVLNEYNREFLSEGKSLLRNKSLVSSKQVFKFIFELSAMLVLAGVILIIVQQGNIFYEKYLANQVKVFEPKFLWLDKNLSFKDEQKQEQSKREILNEISELEEIIQSQSLNPIEREERFETESDVVLSSAGNLSNRLNISSGDTSRYEESNKGIGFNFRSYRYGRNRVYRLMVKSVRPDLTKERLAKLLRKYNVEQADNVIPGTSVPGGLYYNLFVPREYLGEFLFQISDQEEATLYETKTRGANPKDRNKVFIFVKKI